MVRDRENQGWTHDPTVETVEVEVEIDEWCPKRREIVTRTDRFLTARPRPEGGAAGIEVTYHPRHGTILRVERPDLVARLHSRGTINDMAWLAARRLQTLAFLRAVQPGGTLRGAPVDGGGRDGPAIDRVVDAARELERLEAAALDAAGRIGLTIMVAVVHGDEGTPRGETLESIGQRFGLTRHAVADIVRVTLEAVSDAMGRRR